MLLFIKVRKYFKIPKKKQSFVQIEMEMGICDFNISLPSVTQEDRGWKVVLNALRIITVSK